MNQLNKGKVAIVEAYKEQSINAGEPINPRENGIPAQVEDHTPDIVPETQIPNLEKQLTSIQVYKGIQTSSSTGSDCVEATIKV